MFKWIGLVIALVALSLVTSGLASALLDIAAFLTLLWIAWRLSEQQRLAAIARQTDAEPSAQESFRDELAESKKPDGKMNINP